MTEIFKAVPGYEGLEYVSARENMLHAYRTGLKKPHAWIGEMFKFRWYNGRVLGELSDPAPRDHVAEKAADP